MYVDWNSRIINANDVRISPFEHGFLYGVGFFETFCFRQQHIFLLDDHLARLHQSLQHVGIHTSYPRESMFERVQRLLEANQLEEGVIRLNISAGEAGLGDLGSRYESITELLFVRELPKQTQGKKLQLLETIRNTPEGPIRFKSHQYINNRIGRMEIDGQDTEGIFLNSNGILVEGIVSNLFFVKDDIIYTPAVELGLLQGVTRQFVVELARKKGIVVREGFFTPRELRAADEIFLTNAVQGIIPVNHFEGTFPGVEGKMVQQIQHEYQSMRDLLWSIREVK